MMRILTHLTLDPSVGRFQFHTQWPSRRPVQLFFDEVVIRNQARLCGRLAVEPQR